MKVLFRDVDRRAMDIVMDRAPGEARFSTFSPVDQQLHRRIAPVEKVLSLLEALPVYDPPKDLLRQTLQHVAASSSREIPLPKPHTDRPPVA